jgi:hypothetical protein
MTLNAQDYRHETSLTIYALLGGYTNLEEWEIFERIDALARRQPNCLMTLWEMELDGFIKFRSIHILGSNKIYSSLLGEKYKGRDEIIRPVKEILATKPVDGFIQIKPDFVKKEAIAQQLEFYLDAYIKGKIIPKSGHIPLPYSKQKELLLSLLQDKAPDYGNEPVVAAVEFLSLYKDSYKLLFIDTLLSFVYEKFLTIRNLECEYAQVTKVKGQEPVLYPVPLASLILNDEQQEPSHPTENSVTGEIKLIDNVVTLWLSNLGTVPIKSLRTDGPQFNFMNYVIAHPKTNISRGDVQAQVGGCEDKKDLTEIVRRCGFTPELKKLFFPTCNQLKVTFIPSVQLPKLQAEKLAIRYKSHKIAQNF